MEARIPTVTVINALTEVDRGSRINHIIYALLSDINLFGSIKSILALESHAI